MIISILTLFPQIFSEVFNFSIIGRAQKRKILSFRYIDIRNFAKDKYKSVDDKPYGGGLGMLMRVDVVEKAISAARLNKSKPKIKEKVILLDPKGKTFNQSLAKQYSKLDHLILVCGHYEGIDHRINYFIDESISIGDYILTGGEIPAMVLIDSIARLIPKVLLKKEAVIHESF